MVAVKLIEFSSSWNVIWTGVFPEFDETIPKTFTIASGVTAVQFFPIAVRVGLWSKKDPRLTGPSTDGFSEEDANTVTL